MSNTSKKSGCGKYAYAITITETHVKNAIDQVHDAWDANRETRQSILR